uniref:Uncharacterized protein n=1 Tax=Anopheles minimus TaxID=112268 RepID=A0A182WMP7_9DIPT
MFFFTCVMFRLSRIITLLVLYGLQIPIYYFRCGIDGLFGNDACVFFECTHCKYELL